jgi:hypothetical protein
VRSLKADLHSHTEFISAGMHEPGQPCTELLETTANALNDGVVAVMVLAVKRGNLELSINAAVMRFVFQYK